MSELIAVLITVSAIGLLFFLSREPEARVSPALWLAVLWLLIGSTRNISEWLQATPPADAVGRYMDGNPVDRAILTLLMALAGAVLLSRWRRVGKVLRSNLPVLVYFAFCGLSALWSIYPAVSGKRWLRALGDLLMVLIIATDKSGVAAVQQALQRVAVLVLPVSVLLIRYFPDLGIDYAPDGTRFARGVAGGKNGLGALCLIFGLAALWQLLKAWRSQRGRIRTRKVVAYTILLGTAIYLLYISDSKTSLACFVLVGTLLVLMLATRVAENRRLLGICVVGVIASCAAVLFLGFGSGALEAMGRDPTLTGRTEVWKLVLQFAANPFVGAGYESFWMGKRLVDITAINGGINQAHNGYIEIYLNLGWAGLGILLTILVSSLFSAVSHLRARDDLAALGIAYMTIAVIFNFTEAAFKMMSPVWILLLLSIVVLRSRAGMQVTVRQKALMAEKCRGSYPLGSGAGWVSPHFQAPSPTGTGKPRPSPARIGTAF